MDVLRSLPRLPDPRQATILKLYQSSLTRWDFIILFNKIITNKNYSTSVYQHSQVIVIVFEIINMQQLCRQLRDRSECQRSQT